MGTKNQPGKFDCYACKSGCDADCLRASGEVICDHCGQPYRKHRYCAQSRLDNTGSRNCGHCGVPMSFSSF